MGVGPEGGSRIGSWMAKRGFEGWRPERRSGLGVEGGLMPRGGRGSAWLVSWRVWCRAVEKGQPIALVFCYTAIESSLQFPPSVQFVNAVF